MLHVLYTVYAVYSCWRRRRFRHFVSASAVRPLVAAVDNSDGKMRLWHHHRAVDSALLCVPWAAAAAAAVLYSTGLL